MDTAVIDTACPAAAAAAADCAAGAATNRRRVGLQLGLLAANICAFDFPSSWPDVLQQLLAAAHWGSPYAPQFRLRALRSLKFIYRGLTNKRFVAEPIRGPEGEGVRVGWGGVGVGGRGPGEWRHVEVNTCCCMPCDVCPAAVCVEPSCTGQHLELTHVCPT
jgi:hypothetical protein